MRFYGLFVDLSWEPRIDYGARYLSALIAETPAADPRTRKQVSEVLIADDSADEVRPLIRNRIQVVASFKGDRFYATPSEIGDFGEERLDRVYPALTVLAGDAPDVPGLFIMESETVRLKGFEAARGEPPQLAFECGELSGRVYADRVFAAYQLKPWLRRHDTSFQMLFGATRVLAVLKYVGKRPRIQGVLPVWDAGMANETGRS